jgi:PKD repeat protein
MNKVLQINKLKTNVLVILSLLVIISFNSVFAQNLNTGSKAQSIEDWESGTFTQFEWQMGGNADWTISNVNPYQGNYAARSGVIYDNQTSFISLLYDVYDEDTLSFWFRVSSEANYDYLRFYIDNIMQDEWAGEVPWQQAIYIVDNGTHTFKWEYSKDFSVSTGSDAAWIDYIVFPPMEIEAIFTSDTTIICESDIVHFYDLSIGPVTQWNWIFEGATPSTSTAQNPVVAYTTEGVFDVFLEVSDGVESDEIFMAEYITVGSVPLTANTPSGITYLCASWGNTTYNTAPLPNVTVYDWQVSPPDAGTIAGTGTSVTVVWDQDFLGIAQLKVAGTNYCGIGSYSNPLNITRYLPEVTLPFLGYYSIITPPFPLSGGMPAGGTYSGPGVSNGIFDASLAGLGTHMITYTYEDLNVCTNTDQDSIVVVEFTGIGQVTGQDAVYIYPNPNDGDFKFQVTQITPEPFEYKIYNPLGKEVLTKKTSPGMIYIENVILTDYSPGMYYLIISGTELNVVKKFTVK